MCRRQKTMKKANGVQVALKWRKRIAVLLALSSGASLIYTLVAYYVGSLNGSWLSRGTVASVGGFFVAFIIYKMPNGWPRYEPNRARTLAKISFIFLGAFFSGVIVFFATGFLLMEILGGPIPAGPLGNGFLIFAWIIAPVIGGFIGHLIFKRSKYSDPSLYSGYS